MKLCLIEYVLNEVNLMYLQRVQKTVKKGIQIMLKSGERVCLKEYADLSKGSRVCMRKRTFQVAYGQKRSKSAKTGVTTMVLFWLMVLKKGPVVLKAHGIVLACGIEKG